jgi:hypothetical protein
MVHELILTINRGLKLRQKKQSNQSKKLFRPPIVNHFLKGPHISAISLTTTRSKPPLLDFPSDGPSIDEIMPDSLYDEHIVSRIAVQLTLKTHQDKGSVEHVWFHLNIGATCTVSHKSGTTHCPTPTSAQCGTAANGPAHGIESLGCLVGDFEMTNSQVIPFEIPDHATIHPFKQCSMSLHALKDIRSNTLCLVHCW